MPSAPKLWTALSVEICSTNSVNCFKRLLKCHYFKLAFDLLTTEITVIWVFYIAVIIFYIIL